MNIALIIAGGIGARMHQTIPKQFINVNDKPIIIYTLEAFQQHPNIDAIEVVCVDGWEQNLRSYCKQFNITKLENIVRGGATGQESIRNGITDIATRHDDDSIVLVHDAIRPMISHEIISDCISVVNRCGNAISAIPCAEAMIKTVDGSSGTEQVARDNLKRTQTPQGAKLGELISAHKEALEKGITASIATCTMFVELGKRVFFSCGSEKNIKITTPEDLEIFKALLAAKKREL